MVANKIKIKAQRRKEEAKMKIFKRKWVVGKYMFHKKPPYLKYRTKRDQKII